MWTYVIYVDLCYLCVSMWTYVIYVYLCRLMSFNAKYKSYLILEYVVKIIYIHVLFLGALRYSYSAIRVSQRA